MFLCAPHHRPCPRTASAASGVLRGAVLAGLATLVACGGGVGGTSSQYTIGGTVSGLAAGKQVVLSNSGVQSVTVSANGSFQFAYPSIPGSAYSVSVSSQPSGQSCSVANGSGRANNNVSSIAVTCTAAASRYVYTVNGGSNTISSYTINTSTALLSALASTGANTPANTSPEVGAMAPDGSLLFILNPKSCCASSAEVTMFSVDTRTGTLSFAASTVVGNTAAGMAVDGSGSYLYVSKYDASLVSAYVLDRSTGLLSTLGDTSLTFGAGPLGLAADPSGKFLYSANNSNNTVTALRIGTGGLLTVVGSSPTGSNPRAVAVDPGGRFAFVANNGDNTISAYRINSTTGALTLVASTATTSAPFTLTVAPNGRWVLAASTSGASISSFGINSTTGALTAIHSVALASAPQSLVVNAASTHVYASSRGDNTVSVLQIDASTGQLSFAGSSGTGTSPAIVFVAPGS